MGYKIRYDFPSHTAAERISINNFVNANCCASLCIINKVNNHQL